MFIPCRKAPPCSFTGFGSKQVNNLLRFFPWPPGAVRHGGIDLGIVGVLAEQFIRSLLKLPGRSDPELFVRLDKDGFSPRKTKAEEKGAFAWVAESQSPDRFKALARKT